MDSKGPRVERLNNLYRNILNGRAKISKLNYQQFLEAICVQPNAPTCLSELFSKGRDSLQQAMWYDLSPKFINGLATKVLQYLSASGLADIGGGNLLKDVLTAIVQPPIFWNAAEQALRANHLDDDAKLAFLWLLYHLIDLLSIDESEAYRSVAEDSTVIAPLLASPKADIRNLAEKLKHRTSTLKKGETVAQGINGPGGRHNNDFPDFRQISIIPTADELQSIEPVFLRPNEMFNEEASKDSRESIYLDNQFRLLREDMIYEIREELQAEKKRKKSRNFSITGLKLLSAHHEIENGKKRGKRWGIVLQCSNDFPEMRKLDPKDLKKRKDWLNDNRNFVKHGSMAYLMVEQELVALVTIERDEDYLVRQPPCLVLRIEGAESIVQAFLKMKTATNMKLVQINTAIFAYEPVLKALQAAKSIPLSPELLFWEEDSQIRYSESYPAFVVASLRSRPEGDIAPLLRIKGPIKLDQSQSASLLMGLTQTVSLIQGPPGTGKSFIGALLGKSLHDFTQQKLLVVCYTNHALDQFLEDLLDNNIPPDSMVRLGGKSTDRTKPLSLDTARRGSAGQKLTGMDWNKVRELELEVAQLESKLLAASNDYTSATISYSSILEYLEFEEPEYFVAFEVPQSEDGGKVVGKKGKAVSSSYLIEQWVKGWDGGVFKNNPVVQTSPQVWQMDPGSRKKKHRQWSEDLLKSKITEIHVMGKLYDAAQSKLDHIFDQKIGQILANKRIVACTTTAAAKYRDQIISASPDVLLVEEAGEILESHILTSLGSTVEKLILIGDHKQLRPKVNNYQLTVEKGEGYDLNRSLFERLVLKGYPHETLSQQHRMRPEISALVRHLTYPDLVDADRTKNRPDIVGLRDNVVFINHERPEDDLDELTQAGIGSHEFGSKSSKRNKYEVEMTLKIVRYLGQQGYQTKELVILTPYLGQLRALQKALQAISDPILNDLDSADLVRAGLVSHATAKMVKKPIRLATIDNYQGEESDIVIVSLTRSNRQYQIGFMSSPERVNVLLSRARNGLIMLGNAKTFQQSKTGKKVWSPLFEMLRKDGHVYDGLPIKCEKHPDKEALIQNPEEFDEKSPDGGCTQPCGEKLSCGLHACPSKCHRISDHSKMKCQVPCSDKCSRGHLKRWLCSNGPPGTCPTCSKEDKIAEEKQKAEFAAQQKRDEEQRLHDQKMAEVNAQIAAEREALRDMQLAEERTKALEQKQKDLEEAAAQKAQFSLFRGFVSKIASTVSNTLSTALQTPTATATAPNPQANKSPPAPSDSKSTPAASSAPAPAPPAPPLRSAAGDEWQRQKNLEGANNTAIDAIMDMSGLEKVKEQILNIKAKVDVATRQGTSLKDERFSVSMVGNPGTGKTTIARHYSKFLTSMQIIQGTEFYETTGSRLANDGVPEVKKQIETILKAGGGVFFIDEAYQLTSQHNFEGGKVLDFLLAEIENQVGKIAFIFAGYNREMEKFFEHNPGIPSRVPYTFQFEDYSDEILMDMLEKKLVKTFQGRMRVDDPNAIRGLYGRIAIRRLGRGRGKPGFGNARSLEILISRIRERQATRLTKERREGKRPNDLLLKPEDLIGPDPSTVMVESVAYKKLQGMIGLTTVKQSVDNFVAMIKTNYQRELLEKAPHQVPLNRVFLGNPGTGKTTVAKLYGKILAELGLLSNGEVIVKNPSDFVGAALGQSESKTKGILAATQGKVLLIDEAYGLYGGSGGDGNGVKDPYKTAVIDTIVAEVQSTPGEDRCVLLLGYKEQMEEMFQNVNPGLSRRFAIENAFYFNDYSDEELLKALEWKLKDQDLTATDQAKQVAIQVLSRGRNRPNFGNIGEVENLLSQAKIRYQSRSKSPDAPFEVEDFDPDYKRGERAAINLSKLFEDVVGCDEVIKKLTKYQAVAQSAKRIGKDPRDYVPTNFIFKGPPGTGKTTTARKMGQVFFDMGFLSSTEVVECSTSDLVAQYVGQTGPKTRKVLDKALGRVLFIDEAYRLGEGHFAKESMDELVTCLTQDKYRGKMIVILAGYDNEMNKLLTVNPGLSSRFPEEVIFTNMPTSQCMELLRRELRKSQVSCSALDDSSSPHHQVIVKVVETLTRMPDWGNARDLKELSKSMVQHVFSSLTDTAESVDSNNCLKLEGDDAVKCAMDMLASKKGRAVDLSSLISMSQGSERLPMATSNSDPPPPPQTTISQTTVQAPPQAIPKRKSGSGDEEPDAPRDPGVTDAVWSELQTAKRAQKQARKEAEDRQRILEEEKREADRKQEEAKQALEKAIKDELAAREASKKKELMRLREEARLREIKLREEQARIARLLEEKRQEEERKRREEARVQAKIRQMGVCVAGFQWIKLGNGYQCAGGSHFLSNSQLGI